jgi:autotransporter passenger strand-loop-strand repeat protein
MIVVRDRDSLSIDTQWTISGITYSGTLLASSGDDVYMPGVFTIDGAVVLSGGSADVGPNGTANSTIVAGGSLDDFGGRVNSTTVSSGGSVLVDKFSQASATVLNGGHLDDDGTAYETTVNSGGSFSVQSGAYASGTTVSTGGLLFMAGLGSGTTLTGTSGLSRRIQTGPRAPTSPLPPGSIPVFTPGTT